MSGSGASNLGYGNIYPNSNVNGSFVNKFNSNNPLGFGSNEIPDGGANGLLSAKNNIDAANSCIPGFCFKGGNKKNMKKNMKKNTKQNIKNISSIYMTGYKKKARTVKRKLIKKYGGKLGYGGRRGGTRHNKSGGRRGGTRRGGTRRGGRCGGTRGGTRHNKSGGRGDTNPIPDGSHMHPNGTIMKDSDMKGGYSQYQNNMPLTPSYSVGGPLSANNSALANPPPIKPIGGNCIDNYDHYTNKGFPSRGWH